MESIVDEVGYQYAALACATCFIIPQIRLAYVTRSAKDVSTASMVFVIAGSALWGVYMYEKRLIAYTVLTLFVGTCATSMVIFQFYLYTQRVNSHMLSFDKPPTPAIALQCAGDNAV